MTSRSDVVETLRKLVRRRTIVDMWTLFDALGTRSRMTVFRRLKEVGYRSSYTHAGRYYTLADIPQFDEFGLWFCWDVGFSQSGTLKQTVAVQVEQAPDGRTHAELRHLLRVRVHNTLLSLVREGRIGREQFEGVHLYVSAELQRAAQQVERRRQVAAVLAEALRVPTAEEVVEVLVEALRAAPEVPVPALVARRLAARGVRLESRHVQQVFDAHGLVPGKKTAPPSSPPSRR